MTYNKFFILISITIGGLLLSSCSYSFTGSSVPAHLNTISIPLALDRSGSGEPDLSENLTNELITKFLNDNSLQIADRVNADAILECTITSIPDIPEVISGGEEVTLRKITLNIKVTYRDLVERKTIFDRNFSNFGNYSVDSPDIQQARLDAISQAIDLITEDILLAVVSNW
ncbi:MAG: hypothetical protein K8F60_10175 [Melioribacteraceae bacterium]|jgi:hypothetical protein|nr:hypothetical protein [Ignavibacteriota bacterium]MBZ0182812.1 hypothetical protein [Melioribacteraceae bacterium]